MNRAVAVTKKHLAALREYYRAVDANDIKGLLTLFSDDVCYDREGTQVISGLKPLKYFYEHTRIIDNGRHFKLKFSLLQRSIHTEGCFQGLLKSGESVTVRFKEIFYFNQDGKITKRLTRFPAGEKKI